VLRAKAYQEGRTVLAAEIIGVMLKAPLRPPISEANACRPRMDIVGEYFESLGMDSRGYFEKSGFVDYTYPFAYALSLPSGEVVRQMSGQGGMLNVMRMDAKRPEKIPFVADEEPMVRIERPRRRMTFNRIITEVQQRDLTYYNGSLIVNPRVPRGPGG
jgi:hypothetical protein